LTTQPPLWLTRLVTLTAGWHFCPSSSSSPLVFLIAKLFFLDWLLKTQAVEGEGVWKRSYLVWILLPPLEGISIVTITITIIIQQISIRTCLLLLAPLA
jgi:hypothetical protein